MPQHAPRIVVLFGSANDMKKFERGVEEMKEVFRGIGVRCEMSVMSCHRQPDVVRNYCREMRDAGTRVFIGVAGMAAGLPGMIAAWIEYQRPTLGIPLTSDIPGGSDSIMSVARMPPGCPLATSGVDSFKNTALFACQILGTQDEEVQKGLCRYLAESQKPPERGVWSTETERSTPP